MPRKRPTPWIHRWSRPLMAGLASIGAAVTAYLTYSKLTGDGAACPTSGCDIVLSSPYATVFGLPLALFGFLAYASIVVFAIAPLIFKPAKPSVAADASKLKQTANPLEHGTGLLLFLGSTAMMVFSFYLMYLLVFEIKAVCVYCVASAILSTSLFVLALVGRNWEDVGQLFFSGTIVGLLVLVGTLGVYANINNPATAQSESSRAAAQMGYDITTPSGESEIALAKHLKQAGAVFYGAFWCPHCHEQKQLFGKEAVEFVPYVECSTPDRQGQTPACQEKQIRSYPTWEINGQRLTGEQSLEQLAELSGYQGPRNFQNVLPGK